MCISFLNDYIYYIHIQSGIYSDFPPSLIHNLFFIYIYIYIYIFIQYTKVFQDFGENFFNPKILTKKTKQFGNFAAKELTNRAFCRLLTQTAHALGFHVKRWPLADAAGYGKPT